MAKKKDNTKKKKQVAVELDKSILPQNILEIGEHNQEDKKVYVSQDVYQEIHNFTKDKKVVESGGVILGNVIEEFGKTHIIIRAFIEAKRCEGTPTTLKFTHESWEYIHSIADKKYPDYKILGWIHTHPNFGIFLSEYDKFIQDNFFNEENQVAYVVDPIQKIEGFYFWINGKLERCKGFFVFDKTGKEIAVDDGSEKQETELPAKNNSMLKNILIAVLFISVAVLFVFNLSLRSQINVIQTQIHEVIASANAALGTANNKITDLCNTVINLDNRLKALEPETEPPTEPETTTEENTTAEETTAEETTAEPTTAEITIVAENP